MSTTLRTTAILAALLLATALAPARALDQNVGATAGKTPAEWSALWWQWMTSIPTAENPQMTQGEVDCGVGQQGPVWFLAGAPSGVTAQRSCTVPRGKALFFPVFNAVFINGPGEDLTVAEKRHALDSFLNDTEPGPFADLGFPGSRACDLVATLDGMPVTYFVPDARVQSPAFHLDTGDGPNFLPPGLVDPEAVSDGFWVMLPPLAPGEHSLHFGGRLCQFESFDDHPFFGPVDVTYQLTVTGQGSDPQPPPPGGQPSNAEIVLSLYQAFAEGDLDTILAIIHPDVVWIESDGIPYGGTFIGRDAVFDGVFAKIAAEWDGFTAEVDEIFEAEDDRVVTLGRDSGTFKATGKSMEAPTASIWTLDPQGRVVRFVQYIDTYKVISATLP